MNLLLEETLLAGAYNRCKNQKEQCDYSCGVKFVNDNFFQEKINVCKANCDVIFEAAFIRQLNQLLNSNSLNPQLVDNIKNRLFASRKRLVLAKQRLLKNKQKLNELIYGRKADMSMRQVKNGPAFES